MKNGMVRKMAVIGLTAAVYVVLTLSLAWIGYGPVQCRVSEVMNLLAFFNPIFAPGVILGCFIANLFSPFGLYDIVFGTLMTVCAVFFITRSKNLLIASFYPTIFCVFIGLEIMLIEKIYSVGFFLSTTAVIMVGEFIAVTVIGYSLFRYIMARHSNFIEFLKNL